MSDMVIGDYTAAATIDGSTHYLLIQPGNSSTAYKKINRNVFLGITGQPVDISSTQTISGKTLDNSNTITLKDTLFTLQDDGDTTKQAKFQLSGLTTATTRTYTLPNASSTLADISSSQTLTNKTLTAPVITGGSIDNSTITVDSITGHTTANTGTIYGLAITASTISGASLAAGTVGSTALATNAVQASQLATNAITLGYAQSTTTFTSTTVGSYVDVTNLTVTVTVPSGGRRIKITTQARSFWSSQTAGNGLFLQIAEGSTQLAEVLVNTPVANYRQNGLCIASFVPTAGSHTYKVSIQQGASGTMTYDATSTGPAFILVEAI